MAIDINKKTLHHFLLSDAFSKVELELKKPRTVWVATIEVKISRLEGTRFQLN
jgi:hypothetical protein